MEDAYLLTEILEQAYENYTASELDLIPNPCKPTGRSNPTPSDARKLKPADVELIISMGDSIVTGALALGIPTPWEHWDNRAYSFCGGSNGYLNSETLPTSLKAFNPALTGYAIGSGDQNSANARLNVAVDGATSETLGPQVTHLISKLNSYPRNAWKHISIFIGGNDLCASCGDWNRYSPARYRANLEAVLDRIKANIPRVFLSLITPPDITILNLLSGGHCWIFTPFTCGCKTNLGTKDLHRQYSQVLRDIEALPKYQDKEDFYLSVQPFLENIHLPLNPDRTPDLTYFAVDCFHLSAKGHYAAGQGFWTNLMQSRGSKDRQWVIGEPWICPGPDQYLQ